MTFERKKFSIFVRPNYYFFPSSPSDGERYNGGGSLLLLLRAGHGRPGEVLKVLRGGRGHPLHRPRRTLYQRPRPVHTIQEAGIKTFLQKAEENVLLQILIKPHLFMRLWACG